MRTSDARHNVGHPLPCQHLAIALLHKFEDEVCLHRLIHATSFPGHRRGHHKAPAECRHDEFSTMI